MCRYYIIFLQFMEELFTKWCAIIGPCGVIPQCHKTVALNCNNIQKRRCSMKNMKKLCVGNNAQWKHMKAAFCVCCKTWTNSTRVDDFSMKKGADQSDVGPMIGQSDSVAVALLCPRLHYPQEIVTPPLPAPWQRHKKSPDLEKSLIVQGKDKDKGKDGSIIQMK